MKKFQQLFLADSEKMVVENDNKTTVENIEAVFQPQTIAGIDEITEEKLSEPGRPYYFKLRAIYKGYDAETKRAFLQGPGQSRAKPDGVDTAPGAIFGIDTGAWPVRSFDTAIPAFPAEANTVATFYLVALRFTEDEGGETNRIMIAVRLVYDIEKPAFDPAQFIVADGMHYITAEDVRANSPGDAADRVPGISGVFDPVVYPLVDLMDARVAMDRKDIGNDYTFPAVKTKYVSEVIFKEQSNITVTVSAPGSILTERMNFTGQASTVKKGGKIRVYYTIAKDPLEKWEAQAIERLPSG